MSSAQTLILLTLALTIFGEEVPASIRQGEWRYTWDGTKLPQGKIPDSFWGEFPRVFIVVRMGENDLKAMDQAKTLDAFVRSKTSSIEDILKIVWGDKPGEWLSGEIAPAPTPAQEAWAASLTKTWLIPVPDGYVSSSEGGGLDAWNKWAWNNTSRIRVVHRYMGSSCLGGEL